MNSCEIQCITEWLQIDNARLNTKIQSQIDKTNDLELENSHKSGLRSNPKHLMCTF